MATFKVGQEVVCVDDSGMTMRKHLYLTKGKIYVIEKIMHCPHCGITCFYLVGINNTFGYTCTSCGRSEDNTRIMFRSIRFRPLNRSASETHNDIIKSIPMQEGVELVKQLEPELEQVL